MNTWLKVGLSGTALFFLANLGIADTTTSDTTAVRHYAIDQATNKVALKAETDFDRFAKKTGRTSDEVNRLNENCHDNILQLKDISISSSGGLEAYGDFGGKDKVGNQKSPVWVHIMGSKQQGLNEYRGYVCKDNKKSSYYWVAKQITPTTAEVTTFDKDGKDPVCMTNVNFHQK